MAHARSGSRGSGLGGIPTAVARTRVAIVGQATSLDALSASAERPTRDLRWVMAHMIEEYARHNGHADLLRECIDGAVGD